MPANPKLGNVRTRLKAARLSPPSPERGVEGKPALSPQGVLHRLNLSVQYACACNDAALPSRPLLRKWVRAALDADAGAAAVTLRFVDAEEGRMLNRQYRGKNKDHATNVLSFPYEPHPRLSGDLVLCVPVVVDEAASQGKPVEAHFAHLVVHGMLHLQGYDHQNAAEAELMEAKERVILARFGIPDPY